jgi:hypothetical protein
MDHFFNKKFSKTDSIEISKLGNMNSFGKTVAIIIKQCVAPV